jgi:GNAT superfamily N-acetyltransferase
VSEFVIRLATASDEDRLRVLIEASVRGLQTDDYTAAQIDGALGYAFGLDRRLIADGTYFVAAPAAEPERLVACGGWSFRRTLFGADHGPGREEGVLDPIVDAARIRAIFVDPAWARRGLGSLVLAHCEEAARQAGFIRAEMGSTLTGLALYRLRGYVDGEPVAVPLPNGESLAVVRMEKQLDSLRE